MVDGLLGRFNKGMNTKVLFILQASSKIGQGHFYRCLALAQFLENKNCDITFCMDVDDTGVNLISLIKKHQYKYFFAKFTDLSFLDSAIIKMTEHKYQWAIVDSPSDTSDLQLRLKEFNYKVMVIDDSNEHLFYCDILLNSNYSISQSIYNDKPNIIKSILVGTKYVVLRSEFLEYQSFEKDFSKKKLSVNMFFGNSDKINDCICYIDELVNKLLTHKITLVDQHLKNVNKKFFKMIESKNKNRFKFFDSNVNMADIYYRTDVAFGAPGISTWERAYFGIPTVYLAYNQIQCDIIEKLTLDGYCQNLGILGKTLQTNIYDYFMEFLNDRKNLNKISDKCRELIDGKGGQRIYDAMFN
jgi:spore coat polysaccharide biosynthesis predicted glycosyltransferase SpsG